MHRFLLRLLLATVLTAWALTTPSVAAAAGASSTVVFRFTPVKRAQMALWLESPDGKFLGTVRLTQSVSYYGIGNRPGASQMNSGFRWPYGRREGVLPVWAHRRASLPGALLFRRVIFQNRESEGDASRTSNDPSPDVYFCLSFDQSSTRQDALDAVTCASRFSSDKGRYLKKEEGGVYAEPVQSGNQGSMRPLSYDSYYPPRRDVTRCTPGVGDCNDTADVSTFASDARTVMPEIDAVTMATSPGGTTQEVLFTVPASWSGTDFVAWLEISVEGDHNTTFSEAAYPTPILPSDKWDTWAESYGYPYRGQPSVVFSLPFSTKQTLPAVANAPSGYGSLSGYGDDAGMMRPMDTGISDDPARTPGSGADRLSKMSDGARLTVVVRDCQVGTAPTAISNLTVRPIANEKHSHEWGTLSFTPPSSGGPINHYDVRFSREPITDETTFMHALPALQADVDSMALMLPSAPDGQNRVTADFGGLIPLTSYYVGVRAVDNCNKPGPIVAGRVTTTKINFTQLPPVRPWKGECFVATAAYGSAMAPAVDAIREVRDGARERSGLFAAIDDLYHQAVPPAAHALAQSDTARAVFRELLSPVARASSLAHPSSAGTKPEASNGSRIRAH